MSKIINITESFRIVQDDRDYILQKLTKINPTKSPRFDPEKDDPTPRQEWKDEGYYGLGYRGFSSSALKQIIVYEAGLNKKDVSLSEYVREVIDIGKRIEDAVKGKFEGNIGR